MPAAVPGFNKVLWKSLYGGVLKEAGPRTMQLVSLLCLSFSNYKTRKAEMHRGLFVCLLVFETRSLSTPLAGLELLM